MSNDSILWKGFNQTILITVANALGHRKAIAMIDIPTERTTAATDLLLAAIAFASLVAISRYHASRPGKATLWMSIFGMLVVASGLGAVAHGVAMSPETNRMLWHPLNLALGVMVALILVAAVLDKWGEQLAWRIMPATLLLGIGFFGVTVLWENTFLAFVVFEVVAMSLVVGIYFSLVWHGRGARHVLMVFGMLLTIAAAAVQATCDINFHCLWTFDQNGVFHLIQLPAVVCLATSVVCDLRASSGAGDGENHNASAHIRTSVQPRQQ